MVRRILLSSLFVLAAVGCEQKEDHPGAAVITCEGGKCVSPGPGGGGGGKDGGGDAGSDASVDAPEGVTVTGSVVELTSDDFSTAQPYAASATIQLEGANGIPVEGPYTGTTFSVSNVAFGQGVWATVTPQASIILPTIQPTDTTVSPVELAVVPAATIDLIYNLLSVPTERTPKAAHVVIRFVDGKTGVPVSGVSVTHKTDVVAYDTGGSWSDTASGTGVEGTAVIANVASVAVPNKQSFDYVAPGASGGVFLLVAQDSVTIATVPL
ncbi:MAG: hypothetical protein U0263_26910 [Polyangiaceae bacterium]